MKFLGLGLLLMCWAQLALLSDPEPPALRIRKGSKQWIRKEVGAVIYMTVEFVKDMEQKMRDVHRVESLYTGTIDFGAAKLQNAVRNKFAHMVKIYQDYGSVSYLFPSDRKDEKPHDKVVGMLQFMLGDYCELLSLVDVYKERHTQWKTMAIRWQKRDRIENFLKTRDVFPANLENRPDQW